MSNWEIKRLGDITSWFSGGTPKKDEPAYWNGDIPWISANSMDGTRYYTSDLKITAEGLKNGSRLAPQDAILLLVRGSALHTKIPVGIARRPLAFNQDVKAIVAKPNLIDPWFLFAWFMSKKDYLLNNVVEYTGIGAGKLDTIRLQNLEINLPSIKEQKALSHIVNRLEDKIELNRQMNETLEAIARALFKSWFVDFDPVRAKMEGRQPFGMDEETAALFPNDFEDSTAKKLPKGYRMGTLRDGCIRIENGGTPSRNTPSYWEPKTIPWLTSGEVRQSIVHATKDFISEEGFINSSAKLWPRGTTVVALYGATAGQACFLAKEMTTNQACCGLIPNTDMQYYIYLHLSSSVETLERQARGSAQQNLSQQIVADYPMLIPDYLILRRFHEFVSPLFEKWIANLTESCSLASIRDLLLPKLLSGEIRVKDVEKLVEAAV